MGRRYILVIDGGGVKSCVSATFLHFLEVYLGKPLYDIFDVFCGTSAGALLVSCLSVKKMKMCEIQQLYRKEYLEEFFSGCEEPGSFLDGQIYNGCSKRYVLNKIFGEENSCKQDKVLLIPVHIWDIHSDVIYDNTKKPYCESMSKLLDAASAALVYFPAIRMSNGQLGMDAGLFLNTPVCAAVDRAKELYPDDDLYVLSVGSGSSFSGPKPDLCKVKKYIRINEPLFGASIMMDNYKQSNIDKLRRNGNKWWYKNKLDVESFFS